METPVPPRRLARSFLPATAVLEVTGRCNHACVFCSCPWYDGGGGFPEPAEMPLAEWEEHLAALAGLGVVNFAFTGGEPLLFPGIADLVAFAAGLTVEHVETVEGRLEARTGPPRLYLLSNGKAMSAEVIDLCARHDVSLSMSLPGLTTFPEHTRGGTDANHVLAWFTRAKAAGLKTTVGVTATRRNLFELYETIGEALLAGADKLLLNRFLPGGRGLAHAADLTLSRAEITEMLDTAESVLRAANRYGSVGTELPACIVDATRYQRLRVGTRCSAARDFFVIGPSGRVRVCNHSPVELTHVRDVLTLKDDPYWRAFARQEYLPAACGGCPSRLACDGGCREAAHIAGGAIDSPDPLVTRP